MNAPDERLTDAELSALRILLIKRASVIPRSFTVPSVCERQGAFHQSLIDYGIVGYLVAITVLFCWFFATL